MSVTEVTLWCVSKVGHAMICLSLRLHDGKVGHMMIHL